MRLVTTVFVLQLNETVEIGCIVSSQKRFGFFVLKP
jgi:hypothetical protein